MSDLLALKAELETVNAEVLSSPEHRKAVLTSQIAEAEASAEEEKKQRAKDNERRNTEKQLADMKRQLSEIDRSVEKLDGQYAALHASINDCYGITSSEQTKMELQLARQKLNYFSKPHMASRNILGVFKNISEMVTLPEVRS